MKSSHLALQKMAGKIGVMMIAAGIAVVLLINFLILKNESENRYDQIILHWAKCYEVDPCLIKAIIKRESGFDQRAIGGKGEVGLMQLMLPAVQDWADATNNEMLTKRDLLDPKLNIEVGAWYFSKAYKDWKGRSEHVEGLALAQYNAGPGNLSKWVREHGLEKELNQIIRFDSTRAYVSKILDYYKEYKLNGEFNNQGHDCRLARNSR